MRAQNRTISPQRAPMNGRTKLHFKVPVPHARVGRAKSAFGKLAFAYRSGRWDQSEPRSLLLPDLSGLRHANADSRKLRFGPGCSVGFPATSCRWLAARLQCGNRTLATVTKSPTRTFPLGPVRRSQAGVRLSRPAACPAPPPRNPAHQVIISRRPGSHSAAL